MASLDRASLKAKWLQGYIPLESDYEDFFDSFFNVEDDSPTLREVTTTGNLLSTDYMGIVQFNSTGNFNFTLPQLPANFRCDLININTGIITLVAGSGVTIRYENTNRKLSTQYTGVSLYYRSLTEVIIVGKLSA